MCIKGILGAEFWLRVNQKKYASAHRRLILQPTNLTDPTYFHKVVDCQYACPAHTPVPEYIRLIGQGRYTDAYMINWVSNVFPGVLLSLIHI